MDRPPPRILLIEDDVDTADLISECLADYYGRNVCALATTATEAYAVDVDAFDLVLSDMNLPDGNGLEIMHALLARRPDLPIVFVTGENVLSNAIDAVHSGAYDYVVKAGNYMFSIPVVVEKNLELMRIKRQNVELQDRLRAHTEELEQKNELLETAAATDPLTGLANRRSLNSQLAARYAEAERTGGDLACLMMDLDGFKQLNDAAGHPAGDAVLKAMAEAILGTCRRSDVAGRFGGDEFILILPATGLEEARAAADRISEDFSRAADAVCAANDYAGSVTVSMGLAALRLCHADSADQLIVAADEALYAAKHRGKHCLVIAEAA